MIFQTYYSPMDRNYVGNNAPSVEKGASIEEPIMPVSSIGQTVGEGRLGHFIQTATGAIRSGAATLELSTQMGGGEPAAGAESYGKDAREALREMAKVNQVQIVSIHTPAAIGNMSGFNPQRGNFDDEMRKTELDEVKKAIKFAGDAAQGGAVVIHTGEYQRPIFDADWNKEGKWKDAFISYDEEKERAVKLLVDRRTGRLIHEVRMNQIVPRADWNKYDERNELYQKNNGKSYVDEKGNTINPNDYIDYYGNKVDRAHRVPIYDKKEGTFKVTRQTWKDFEKEADEINKEKEKEFGRHLTSEEKITPEEAFLRATTETQAAISRGWARNYALQVDEFFGVRKKLKEARERYNLLEKNIPEDQLPALRQQYIESQHLFGRALPFIAPPSEFKKPTELIDIELKEIEHRIESAREMVTGQLQQAEDQEILKENVLSANKYALKKTMQSYAEAGVTAMKESHHNPYVRKDIFVAPENVFPEMGYGSHPEELIELVKKAREQMVKSLTEKNIEHPSLEIDPDTKEVRKIHNPNYTGMSVEQARKEAEQHIKATLDTQHLGMWWKHFAPNPGETEEQRRKRFNEWYMDEIKKMEKENIIGNIHLVDSLGGGHHHLPAGQGDLPVVEAIKYLKARGYKGFINSEAYEEERYGPGRILVETWRAFGSPLSSYGAPGAPMRWTDVHHSYFGRTYPPYFIFGAYSPSNEWTLWSQVPME